ncbi:MAG TPA: hypothetical protein ENK52_03105, partial [Saprospiraceae bacterium]|nr:hypothetical protein [Saprospiraceae bacterium]
MGDKSKLKILIVCFYFPPFNVAGALRLGRIAQHLSEFGHDIKVIAANNTCEDRSLQFESTLDVRFVNWIDTNSIPKRIIGGQGKTSEITQNDVSHLSTSKKILLNLSKLYKSITNIPDGYAYFAFSALKEAKKISATWKPDIIYSSALPASVALAGHLISNKLKVKWICEFRDLWTTNHYYSFPKWRHVIDKRLEKHVLSNCSSFVTVSEPLADDIRQRFPDKKSEVILNGADVESLSKININKANNNEKKKRLLNIVYTGTLYKGKRDPSKLFKAIANLSKDREIPVNVNFYGKDNTLYINKLAKEFKIEKYVNCYGSVPYLKALSVQRNADLLLLLLWESEKESGVFTGKFFEYIAARRPILAIGHDSNVAINMINKKGLGKALNNVKDI